jgi:hypothetical protein
MAKGRAAVKKRRTVTFDDNTGDVVATEEAGRLAAETEDEESKNDEAEMEADAVEDEEEDISQYLPEGIGPEGIVFKQPIEKDPQAVPVANKNFIPLFPDASKKPKLHATAIKVYKRTPPYDGFKGKVTSIEQVDEEYLSGLWGDGIYDLELIDQMGNILRKNLGVKVAIGGAMNGGNKNEGPSAPAVDVESIVEKITKQSQATIELVMKKLEAERSAERDAAKQERQAEKERNDRFVKLQSDMVESQADQLRAHYEAQAGAASQQTQALLTILTTGHQNMMQQVQAMNLQAQQNNNPVLLLQAFQAGLGERVDAGEKDTTTTIVEGITSGLKDLRGLAEAGNKNGAAPTKQLATGAPTTLAKRPNTGTKPAVKAAPAATGKEPVISKTSLQGILRLKAAAEKKGVAFDDLIAQAEKFYVDGTVPDGILDEEEPEGGPEDEETDDEQGEEGPEDGDGNDESGNKKPAEPPQKPADEVAGT